MLVSGNISQHVVPGIAKAIERYILIYGLDDVLKRANSIIDSKTPGQLIKVAFNRLVLEQAGPGTKGKKQPEEEKQEKKKGKKDGDSSTKVDYKIDSASFGNLTLEPTWMTISTPKTGLQMLGIKVVPFPAKTESLLKVLMQDNSKSIFAYITSKYSRMATRTLFRLLRMLRIPVVKDKVITGDPNIDVVWASTQYRHNIFTCFTQSEVEEIQNVFSSPAMVQKLHKLGWTSFIVTDDVKKTATFCMTEFGGVCSEVPYKYLFSAVKAEKAYDDLDSLQKSSGPFFRMKTTKTKLFNECSFAKKKDIQLQEGIFDSIYNISKDKMFSLLNKAKSVVSTEDPQKIVSHFGAISHISMPVVNKFLNRVSSKFSDTHHFAMVVLENSTDLSPKHASVYATMLSAGAVFSNPENPREDVKQKLKDFVSTQRQARLGGSFISISKLLVACTLTTIGGNAALQVLESSKLNVMTISETIGVLINFIKKIPFKKYLPVLIVLFIILLIYLSRQS
jgi:hypothetical protein